MINQCQSNGITISYEERGSGEPFLLLMGLGAPGSKWELHMRAYEKHFRVIAVDNRGTGLSDKPFSYAYTIEEMAKDALGVLDHLGIQSAHLNGISMGGAIAQYLAIHYPQRVRSVILTNTFPYCNVSFRRAIEFLRDSRGQLDDITFGRLVQWIIYAPSFQDRNEAFLLEDEAKGLNAPPMPAYAYKAQCNAILAHNALHDLSKIQAPVLVAAGDHDLFVPVPLTMELYHAIPDAELYLCKDGGHVQHWEHLDAYNDITLKFLLSHSSDFVCSTAEPEQNS